MAIAGTDLHARGSTTSGSAGNSTAFGGAGTSLGKYITNNDITDNTLNNLFPDTTGDENAASQVDYQLEFILNDHATLTWFGVFVWLSAEVAGGSSVALGLDTTAASAKGSASAQAVTIANKNTAPAGATFSSPTTKAAGLSIGNLTAGQVKGVWYRRTAANTVAVDSDGATLRYEGDTGA